MIGILFLISFVSLYHAYKVELNEELMEKLAELKSKASSGTTGEADFLSMEEEHSMMKQILLEMTEDPAVVTEMEMGSDGEGMGLEEAGEEQPEVPCSSMHGCNECIENNCAWCLQSRSCKPDEAWQCQGMEDHVGYAGIGSHTECPTEEELKIKREERKRRPRTFFFIIIIIFFFFFFFFFP